MQEVYCAEGLGPRRCALDPGENSAASGARLFDAMEVPVVTSPETFALAAQLAHELGHHLFDTLYHAVALAEGATLVTADARYCRKAAARGGIVQLAEWSSCP